MGYKVYLHKFENGDSASIHYATTSTCFFGPNLEFVYTRSEMNDHYPQGLIEHLQDGPKKIASPAEAWSHAQRH